MHFVNYYQHMAEHIMILCYVGASIAHWLIQILVSNNKLKNFTSILWILYSAFIMVEFAV